MIYQKRGSFLNFHKQGNAFKALVVGFAGFECFMERSEEEIKKCKIYGKELVTCECRVSRFAELSRHRACTFSICFIDSENEVFYQEMYSGKDAAEKFLSKLPDFEKVVEECKQYFKETSQIIATENDWQKYHAVIFAKENLSRPHVYIEKWSIMITCRGTSVKQLILFATCSTRILSKYLYYIFIMLRGQY